MSASATVTVRRGRLLVPRADHERFIAVDAVVLLRDGADLLLLPVRHAAAGGYLVKMRNAAGDRSIDAADFFREHGIEDAVELTITTTWDAARGALVARDVFPG